MTNPSEQAETLDLTNQAEVEGYFARLRGQYPELVEAIEVMGIPYQQYLVALRFMSQPRTVSTTSGQPALY